jgi:hypothetical protein
VAVVTMRARTAALLTAAGAAALITWSPRLAIGAGPLTRGHAAIENRCAACHAPFRGPSTARCVACHARDSVPSAARAGELGTDRFVTLQGLHRDPGTVDCFACHTDHEGADPANGTKAFAHEQLSRDVLSRCASCHDAVQPADAVHRGPTPCSACHGTTAWTPATFRHDRADAALASRCAECHAEDVPAGDGLHDPAMRACADCHGVDRWTPATFEHARFFQLDRDHDVRCSTCHQDRGQYARYTCYGCHEHTPAGMQREHAEEGITRNLDQCARCHRSADGEGGEHRGRQGED